MMTETMKYFIYALPLLMAACTPAHHAYNDLQNTVGGMVDPNKALVEYGKCPETIVVEDLAYFTEYEASQPRTDAFMKSKAMMTKGSSTCVYENQSVSVDLTLEFRGALGKKGRLRSDDDPLYSYPFFVAIADRTGDILAKQIFAATMPYPSDSNEGFYTETIRQLIPVPSAKKGRDYAVMAGFQLTDQQLEENRAFIKQHKIAVEQAEAYKKSQEPVVVEAESENLPSSYRLMRKKRTTLVPSGR